MPRKFHEAVIQVFQTKQKPSIAEPGYYYLSFGFVFSKFDIENI
jgi:hypothetical protein